MRFVLSTACLLLALLDARADPLRLTSPDFSPGGLIPAQFTCQGRNISPSLDISGVPSAAKSLVLVVDDPDAPSRTFTHWLVWNIPPGTRQIPAGTAPSGALQGANDFGNPGYSGPCPPSGTHRYFFRLSAIDRLLKTAAGASRSDLDAAIQGHVLASTSLMGRFSKMR